MCGFAGVFNYKGEYSLDMNHILGLIHHRGPDRQRVLELSGGISLGFARLSIIDLVGGEQPMENEDGSIIVMLNGELYNYIELREKLIAKGHHFHSKSDTEVMLHMYEEYGISMLEAIQGMFGAVIVDRANRVNYLLRDRMGIKPVYYCEKDRTLGFSSEIKPLLRFPFVSKKIRQESVGEFLNYEYIQAPDTLFADVKKIMPGYYLKLSELGLEEIKYWDCNNIPEVEMDLEQCKKQTLEKMRESVALHLRSDVPLGIFLSGGIDSGLLAALASEQLPSVETYTLRFENGNFDESELAGLVAKRYETNHHCCTVSSENLKQLLPEMLWFCDEPLGDSGILPNYIINELAARDGIKVVLSGAGGDELFGGYPYYFESKREKQINAVPWLSRMLMYGIEPINPRLAQKMKRSLTYRKSPFQHMLMSETIFSNEDLNRYLKSGYRGNSKKEEYYDRYINKGLNSLLYTDIKTYLTDDLLLLSDRTCMASSVEGRVPFLHHPLVEYALSIPEYIKAPEGQRKWLLKKIAEDYLPKEIIYAPKRGFCSPVERWKDEGLAKNAYALLNSDRCLERSVWNADELRKYTTKQENYKKNFSRIYLLLVLELFFRIHIDGCYETKDKISLEAVYGK